MAEEEVEYVQPDGRRIAGRIAIGTPAMIPQTREDDEQGLGPRAGCEFSLQRLEARLRFRLYGETPLQALMLTLRYMGYQLHFFLQSGGRIVYPNTDDDFPIAGYFAGLLTDPPRRDVTR